MSEASDKKTYDQAGKHLSDQDPLGFLRLLGAIAPDEEATVEIIERELITPARAVDGLYRVTSVNGSRLVHGEIQTRWKGAVPARIADYGARIHLLTGEQVESYVLLLTKEPAPPDTLPPAIITAGDLVITKGYRVVRLYELEATPWLASQRPYLMPYIPLMRGGTAELQAAAKVLSHQPDENQRKELAAYFAILGGLRYDRDLLRQIMKEALMLIPREDLRESSMVQMWLEDGREEGREEGRRLTVYEMVRRATRKFFPTYQVGPELEAITDLTALEDLCLTMSALPDVAALEARLLELMPTRPAQNS